MWRMCHQIKKMGHLSVKTPHWKFPHNHAVYKVYTIRRFKYTGLATPGPLVPEWASHQKRSLPDLQGPPLSSKNRILPRTCLIVPFLLNLQQGSKDVQITPIFVARIFPSCLI